LVRWVRSRLPMEQDVSPDERQLDFNDIAAIAKPFSHLEIEYFNLLGRWIRFFPSALSNLERAPALSRAVVTVLMAADRPLARIQVLRRFFGAVTIIARR